MGVLFVHDALRGPKNTTTAVKSEDETAATGTGPVPTHSVARATAVRHDR
ncbi:hypothetical protein [Streptomyces prasinus]